MYFKPLLLVMFVVSKISAFYPKNLYQPSSIVMRMKKTASNNIFDDSFSTSGRKSRQKNIAPLYKPRSKNQHDYVTHLSNASVPIVFGIGPAGCGKTLFACVRAIEGLRRGDFQKIVLTRPIVPVEEEELGFLPGTLVKKMDPWTRPLMDIFLEHYPQHELDFMINSGVIEISPLAYMRGRTFKRCFIIADEMQNSSPGQMLMLTTRIGDGSKMVITGDLKQTDRSQDNGLLDIMNKIKDYKVARSDIGTGAISTKDIGIEMVEMNKGDIERSPIVSKILEIYNSKTDMSDDRMIQAAKQPVVVEHVAEAVSNTTKVPLPIPDKKININSDAALIPLSDISNRFNSPDNTNLIF